MQWWSVLSINPFRERWIEYRIKWPVYTFGLHTHLSVVGCYFPSDIYSLRLPAVCVCVCAMLVYSHFFTNSWKTTCTIDLPYKTVPTLWKLALEIESTGDNLANMPPKTTIGLWYWLSYPLNYATIFFHSLQFCIMLFSVFVKWKWWKAFKESRLRV